jgi:hypothetical protein
MPSQKQLQTDVTNSNNGLHPTVERRRLNYLIAVIAVVILGLSSRRYPQLLPEFLATYAGDTLWALTAFLGIGMLFPKWPTLRVCATAALFALSVEASQLYHSTWIDQLRRTGLGGLVLGYGYLWSDLLCYGVGVSLGGLTEWFLNGRMVRGRLRSS